MNVTPCFELQENYFTGIGKFKKNEECTPLPNRVRGRHTVSYGPS